MSNKTTKLVAPFAGRDRVFCLRIGEIGELETLCNAGIGAIYSRLVTLQMRHADVRETIRLGLVGGGMIESEADFWVSRKIDDSPINPHIQLAVDILRAVFEGVDEAKKGVAADDAPPKKAEDEDRATSPPMSPLA